MKKSILCRAGVLLAAMLFVVGSVKETAHAEETITIEIGDGGYIAPTEDWRTDPNEGSSWAYQLYGSGLYGTGLPSTYDGREKGYLPPIRNQNPYGTCWAFSAIGACEINMCKKMPSLASTIDLSEGHLVYYSKNSEVDLLDNDTQDSSVFTPTANSFSPSTEILEIGGNGIYAYRSLVNWKGLVNEDVMTQNQVKFIYAGSEGAPVPSKALAYNQDAYHLKNFYVMPYRVGGEINATAIKQAIMEYGSVVVNYHALSADESAFNSVTSGQYCSTLERVDHAVLIVGWDDNFAAGMLGTTIHPEHNGAWIIRNSWDDYLGSQGGYFYLSYEDKTIDNDLYIFEVEAYSAHDTIYQRDNTMLTAGISYSSPVKIANYYVSKNDYEVIDAVGIGLTKVYQPVPYTVQVYVNPTDPSNPTTGTPVLETPAEGIFAYAGYQTIEIHPAVGQEDLAILQEGDTFCVVYDFSEATPGTFNIEIETSKIVEYKDTLTDRVVAKWANSAHADAGTSLACSATGNWSDVGRTYNSNFVIKAYTSNVTPAVSCTSITLNETAKALLLNETVTLVPTILPVDADVQTVAWSTSDSSVATVSDTGVVTAVGAGTATITARTRDGSNLTATCEITVTVPVSGVALRPTEVILEAGQTAGLTASVAPATASNKNVTFETSNEAVATVSAEGVVTAVAVGDATITVTTEDGSFTATTAVHVVVKVEGISLDKSTLSLVTGGTYSLVTTISPANATNKSITYTSSNTAVATVSSTGVVTAVGNGTAMITAASADGGKTAVCLVTVTTKVTGVSLSATSLTLYPGSFEQLTATVAPATASNKSVTYSSSNAAVATVSTTGSKGSITAKAPGTTIITVTTADGSKKATCTVTVKSPYEISMAVPSGYGKAELYVDGVAYTPTISGGKYSLILPDGNAKSVIAYKYNESDAPVGMYVWTLSYKSPKYTVTAEPGLEDLLTHHGFSIRITGRAGIRIKTGIEVATREKLLSTGINGYTLQEYGTLRTTKQNMATYPFVYGGTKVKANVTYGIVDGKKVDSVFETVNGRLRYTIVLVGLPNTEYKTEFAFRGYIRLVKNGQELTLYGPPVTRSIYDLSDQLLKMKYYKAGSSQDTFLKNIISDAR